VAEDGDPERVGHLLRMAQVMAVRQQHERRQRRGAERLRAALGQARIEDGTGVDVQVRVHGLPDAVVEGGPVEHPIDHFIHGVLLPASAGL
jgi:hypothetical protein